MISAGKMERSQRPQGDSGSVERRKYPRIEASHPVLYYCHVYPRPKVASTLDLSLGGARVETRYVLMEHEGVDITIAIQPQVIRCRGTVMYVLDGMSEKLQVGVRFDDLCFEDTTILEQYILSRMGEQPA
jgi:c-di-GMP-binding flagellar brake protein YcgR